MRQKIKSMMKDGNYFEIDIYNETAQRHILQALIDYARKYSLAPPELLEERWVPSGY